MRSPSQRHGRLAVPALALVTVACALSGSSCRANKASPEPASSEESWPDAARAGLDWLQGQSWGCLDGATLQNGELRIQPTGRAIIDADDRASTPNPPLNLRGPRLR